MRYLFLPLLWFLVLAISCVTTAPVIAFRDSSATIPIVSGPIERVSPKSWGRGVQATPPDSILFFNIIKELRKAFSKYPDDLLARHVREIVVFEALSFSGAPYAGTYHHNTIYVALRDGLEYVESIFHHEFNTILFENYTELFNLLEWKSNNPEDFNYWDRLRGFNYVKKYGTSQPAFDTTYLSDGFLSEYSMTSLDNDLSRYAENLFRSKKEFWEAFDKYERVRNKTKIVIDFYNKLNPIFTEQYFRKLGN